jgi:hypothetical protein
VEQLTSIHLNVEHFGIGHNADRHRYSIEGQRVVAPGIVDGQLAPVAQDRVFELGRELIDGAATGEGQRGEEGEEEPGAGSGLHGKKILDEGPRG